MSYLRCSFRTRSRAAAPWVAGVLAAGGATRLALVEHLCAEGGGGGGSRGGETFPTAGSLSETTALSFTLGGRTRRRHFLGCSRVPGGLSAALKVQQPRPADISAAPVVDDRVPREPLCRPRLLLLQRFSSPTCGAAGILPSRLPIGRRRRLGILFPSVL